MSEDAQDEPGAPPTGARVAASLTEFLSDPATVQPDRISAADAAAQALALHRENSGCTFSLYFGDASGADLFAVSLYLERSVKLPSEVTSSVLLAFIEANEDLLDDPRNGIGLWFSEEQRVTYLDVSAMLPIRQEAEALGRQYNQEAIYDLARGELIAIGGTGEVIPGLPPEAERLPPLPAFPSA